MKLSDCSDDLYHEPVYTVGHAAKKLGIAVSTLHKYEKAGLLISHRTETNRRLYSRRDLDHVTVIQQLIRKHHLNIEAIKHILSLIPCWRTCDCPENKYSECRAYLDSAVPCWLLSDVAAHRTLDQCRSCEVYLSCPKTLKDPKSLIK